MDTVLLLGSEGYIGHALKLRLLKKGYRVICVDNGSRDVNVREIGSFSATDISNRDVNLYGNEYYFYDFSIDSEYEYLLSIIRDFRPSTIVNLAQQPSAPYSHKSLRHMKYTVRNNEMGTLNCLHAIKESDRDIHLIQIGSMGEYDQSMGVDIEEGVFDFTHNGKTAKNVIYPRRSPSFYHASKIASTYYIDLAVRCWDLSVTDIMQGIVYGNWTPEIEENGMQTRLDSDECFVEGTEVYTPKGILNIEDLEVGDKVYSHRGKIRKINEKMVNNYDGPIINFELNNKISFSSTPNHPFLISLRKDKHGLSKPEWMSADEIYKLSYKRKYDHYDGIEEKFEEAKKLRDSGKTYQKIADILGIQNSRIISWLSKNQKPKTIKRKDKTLKNDIFFMIPIIEEENKEELIIDIRDFISYGVIKKGFIYTQNPSNKEKVWGEKHKIKNILEVDKDFCLLSGYYIAEGSTNSFSFNKNETDYHEDVISIMKSKFDKDIKIYENDNSDGVSLRYNSKILNLLFKKFFGKNAYDKHIPECFMSLPNSHIKELIKGYWRGDGYYSSNGCRYHVSMSSVSKKLLEQIKLLLLRFGIMSSLHKRKRCQVMSFYNREDYEFDSVCYDIVITGEYARTFLSEIADIKDVEYPKRYNNFEYKDDKFMYVKLNDVNITHYIGKRYNFEVEEDNSYLVPVVAHNCFGTVLNRFIIQALIGYPLTVFGSGLQTRGFIALNDSIQCLMLAIENRPNKGEYRTWNQLDQPFKIIDVAEKVRSAFKNVDIKHIPSPRVENTNKVYYHAKTNKIKELGFCSTRTIEQEIEYDINILKKDRYLKDLTKVVIPKIFWRD